MFRFFSDVEKLRNRMSGMVRDGKSKEDIQKMLLAEFAWDPNGNPLKGVDSLINELKR